MIRSMKKVFLFAVAATIMVAAVSCKSNDSKNSEAEQTATEVVVDEATPADDAAPVDNPDGTGPLGTEATGPLGTEGTGPLN